MTSLIDLDIVRVSRPGCDYDLDVMVGGAWVASAKNNHAADDTATEVWYRAVLDQPVADVNWNSAPLNAAQQKTAKCSQDQPCDNPNHNHTGYRMLRCCLPNPLARIQAELARLEDEQCDQDFAQPRADNDTLPGEDCPKYSCSTEATVYAQRTHTQPSLCYAHAFPHHAVSLQSIAIESTLQRNRICANCQGDHITWQCPQIHAILFGPPRCPHCGDVLDWSGPGLCQSCREWNEPGAGLLVAA